VRNSQLTGERGCSGALGGRTISYLVVSSSTKNAIWGVSKILLSLSLQLSGGRRKAVEAGIKRAEGVVVGYKKRDGDSDGEELRKVIV
jgi:hypothetical protein